MGKMKNLAIERNDMIIEQVRDGEPVLTSVLIYRQWRAPVARFLGEVGGKTELVAVAPLHLRHEVAAAVTMKNASIAEAYPEANARCWVYYVDSGCTQAFLTAEAIQL